MVSPLLVVLFRLLNRAVSCLDIAHATLIMDALYVYLIIGFDDESELGRLIPYCLLSVFASSNTCN